MRTVIVGAGEVGSHLAKMLSREGGEVTVIDTAEERLEHVKSIADVATVSGSPTSIKVLQQAGVQKADLFISVYPFATQEMNIVSAILARNMGAKKVTARINDEDFMEASNKLLFKEMGIDLMFFPEKIAADEIISQLRHAGTGESVEFAHGRLQIALFKIEEDSPLLEMKVGDIASLSGDLQFRIIAICRNEDTIIPRFDTSFQYNDMVYTISKREGTDELMKLFGKDNIVIRKVMVAGASQIGELVAKGLCGKVESIKILDKDMNRCMELAQKLDPSIHISNGDIRNTDFLLEESLKDCDAFLALSDDDETNILSCVVARKFGVGKTVAEVENVEYIRLAEEMGVDTVINKKLITAGKLFKYTLSGKARLVKYMSGTTAEILEYTAAPGSMITTGTLKETGFPSNAIIGGVIRGSEAFIAIGSTKIEPYDRVVVFALQEAVGKIDKMFK